MLTWLIFIIVYRSISVDNVLGSEFCSGYTDRFGQWNEGFYCPNDDSSNALYCCGSTNIKYCCTKKEELQRDISDITLIFGTICGAIFAITIVAIFSCFFCRFCPLYKKRHTNVNGPLYQMHCTSTASGVANMYSFSNQNSSATTPIDTSGPHPLVELDYHHSVTGIAAGCAIQEPSPQHMPTSHSFATVDLIPTNVAIIDERDDHPPEDAPPPYEATRSNPPMTIRNDVNDDFHRPHNPYEQHKEPERESDKVIPIENNGSRSNGSPLPPIKSLHSSPASINSGQGNTALAAEEALYWSTKF